MSMPNIPYDGPKPEEELRRLFDEMMKENHFLNSIIVNPIEIRDIEEGGFLIEILIDSIDIGSCFQIIKSKLNIENLSYFANSDYDAKNNKFTITYTVGSAEFNIKNDNSWINDIYGEED